MKQRKPLTEKEHCVRQELVLRRGIVYPPDVGTIAQICEMDVPDVFAIVNGRTDAGIEINEFVDQAVAHVPIASLNRQLAYAQVLFEDKMHRNKTADLPLTMRDPLEILDYARKVVQPMAVNVNVQQNILNEPQIFNLEGMSFEELSALIRTVQGAIDTGEIIDIVARDVEPIALGRPGTVDAQASREVLATANQ